MATLTNFAARDVETLLHPATNLATHRTSGPLLLERAEGIHVWDSTGKQLMKRKGSGHSGKAGAAAGRTDFDKTRTGAGATRQRSRGSGTRTGTLAR